MQRITLEAREFGKSLETDPEVAQAILDLAHGDKATACRIWENPTKAESEAVQVRAWTYARADEDELLWGNWSFVRKEPE